jgi:hypothetical protein
MQILFPTRTEARCASLCIDTRDITVLLGLVFMSENLICYFLSHVSSSKVRDQYS